MGTSQGNYGRKMYSDPLWRKKVGASRRLERIIVTKTCLKCGNYFDVERNISKDGNQIIKFRERQYCSRKCANGHEHSPEWNINISKGQNPKIYQFTCLYCNKEVTTSIRNRKFCSRKCVTEYRKLTTPKYQRYWEDCQFKFNVYDYPDKFDLSLIENHGWYKAKNRGDNPNGISRDHMISIKDGFKNNIDSKIMSHPANCQLLKHNENVSKHSNSSLTLDELLVKIKNW